jgi:hypothetical protein
LIIEDGAGSETFVIETGIGRRMEGKCVCEKTVVASDFFSKTFFPGKTEHGLDYTAEGPAGIRQGWLAVSVVRTVYG